MTLGGEVTDDIEYNVFKRAKTVNLIGSYLTITPVQVAVSSKWYCKFTHDYLQAREDLDLSFSYFNNNVKNAVYNCVD